MMLVERESGGTTTCTTTKGIFDALPQPCRRGEGTLTRQLRQRVPGVVGVDVDTHSVEIARGLDSTGEIEYVTGDFLRADLGVESFDTVVSVAALHHMDTTTALTRMRSLLRLGGVLVVVGLARSRFPADLPLDLAATFASRLYRLKHGYWEHPSPKLWPPPTTYPEVRALANALLPGSRIQRHLLWRYSVYWRKPDRRAP